MAEGVSAVAVTEYLDTIEPDLKNITRLFGLPDSVWDAPCSYSMRMEEDAARYRCTWTDGEHTARLETPIPAETGVARTDALHRRRAVRRLCRQTLYALCRETTGIHPPWGSLTGIRPTRLIYEQLEAGLPLEEAQARVIALFDVRPDKAELLGEIVRTQSLLPPPGDGWMDVYIGIPFCTTRCAYCSFSSGEIGKGKLVEPYLQALFTELEQGAGLIRESGRTLRAVYVGGGTPTALSAEQLERLLDLACGLFPGALEWTVEAGRPDTLSPEKLRVIRAHGVGRISINPQTMNDRTLQVIGRAHTARQVRDAYAMARAESFHHINMDVIAGLPGEGLEDFAVTMEAARELRPESLTVHTLAIKRSSRLHLENAPLPAASVAEGMTEMGRAAAKALGMTPYYLYRQKYMAGNQENVGYALPGHACLYNVDIMEENTHILAFGAGGISKRIYPDEGHIGRAPNVSNIEQYIARVGEMVGRKRALFLSAPGE